MKVCRRKKCDRKFTPNRDHQDYCSPECGNADRQARYRRRQKRREARAQS